MAIAACSDEEFIELFRELGSTGAANKLGVSIRSVFNRRRRLEGERGIALESPVGPGGVKRGVFLPVYPSRLPLEIDSGTVLVGSDAHYWPDIKTTAQRAFIRFSKELKPKLIVLNGDVLDGARYGRHARIGWAKTPTMKEERDACEEALTEIEDTSKSSERIWTIGNHCARFDTYLSNKAPEIEGMPASCLKDLFPKWTHCISAWINDDVVVKHRFKGGVHATHNNTLNAGKTMVTGHLHSLKVTPFDDYNGTRFGVDTGTLAEPAGPQMDYDEDNPKNHRSGFIVLTFHKGVLLWPEIVRVLGPDTVDFRGKLIRV